MAASTTLSPGAKVGGKYEVVEVLGYGGMGVVYKVREQVGAVSRIRALKTVLPQYANDADVVTRFRQEAEKMCMLEHENIVPVLSYSEEGEFPYLVMPFIEGQTLKDYLAAHIKSEDKPLALSEVLEIGLEIVRGLEVAHRFVNPETGRPQPMIHRDIKPGNIMCRIEDRHGERRLRVLIMDFGIAKILSEEETGSSQTNVIGTIKYASPEQIRRGKDIDPRADIYSLGMVLYELYSGNHMLSALTEHAVLMRMMQRDLEPFEIPFLASTPEKFRELIAGAVALQREDRFTSVAEMRPLMRQILEEDSERFVVESRQSRDRAVAARGRAEEVRAAEAAAERFAEGDAQLRKGDADGSEGRHREAVRAFQAASEAFERALEEATRGAERQRLITGLEAIVAKRSRAVGGESATAFVSDALSSAERATAALADAIEAGDLTAGARALAQAERAWREVEAQAEANLRRRVGERQAELARALADAEARLGELPAPIRDRAGHRAVAAVRATVEATQPGDPRLALARADAGLESLRRAETDRKQALTAAAAGSATAFRTALAEIDSTADPALAVAARAEVRTAADGAERALAEGRLLQAHLAFESALQLLERLRAELATEAAAREAAQRDADAEKALRAQQNQRAEPGCVQAHEALNRLGAELANLGTLTPDERRELERAKGGAADGERALRAGEFAAALPPLETARQTMSALVERARERREHERIEARCRELRSEADVRRQRLQALREPAAEDPRSRELLSELAAAEDMAARGKGTEAIARLGPLLAELDLHLEETRRHVERARLEAAAKAARRLTEDALESARGRGLRVVTAPPFLAAIARLQVADRSFSSEDFAAARVAFESITEDLQALVARAERAELDERLTVLRERSGAAVAALGAAPAARSLRKRHKLAVAAFDRCRQAVEKRDEAAAGKALAEAEKVAAELAEARQVAAELARTRAAEAEAARAGETTTRIAPLAAPWPRWWIGGGAGALVASVALWLLLRPEPRPALVVSTSTPPAIESRATAPPAPYIPSPAAVAILPKPPDVAAPPPIAAESAATAIPMPQASPAVEAQPTAPPAITLASAKPAARALTVEAKAEKLFEASVRGTEPSTLEWRLDGRVVARGRSWTLDRTVSGAPGHRKLELVAVRDENPSVLRSWEIDIAPPPFRFGSVDPPGATIERETGSRVSFRAGIVDADPAQVSYRWEVNGENRRDARGPSYDLDPASPGSYVVRVLATAPWGTTVGNTWRVTVRPKPTAAVVPTAVVVAALPPPTPALEPPKNDNLEAEARAWIQAYCSAFQRKDTDSLIALGHISNQDEAARLRDALASMNNLKLSCTNASVRLNGNRAEVSFDRTDHWTDPRGTDMQRSLPRITKTLTRSDGRWVAKP